MSNNLEAELTAAVSPGALLKAARETQELSERETADRLNWMPDYVAVIESDAYDKLRNPAFARGYVKAYARLLDLSQDELLAAFDRKQQENGANGRSKRAERKPLHLQGSGLGALIGVGVLMLLVAFLWWRST